MMQTLLTVDIDENNIVHAIADGDGEFIAEVMFACMKESEEIANIIMYATALYTEHLEKYN